MEVAHSIRCLEQDEALVLILAGELRAACAEELARAARAVAESARAATIDWTSVERIDACALQVLAALLRDRGARGHSLAFTPPSAEVERALRLSGLGALTGTGAAGEVHP